MLRGNSYPVGYLKKYTKLGKPEGNEKNTEDQNEDEEVEKNKLLATAIIPYIKGLSEAVRRILQKYNIRTAFKTTNTLGRMLAKVKDPTPRNERPGVIYKIRCECGDFYIGETGRTLDTRLKEHEAACRLGAFERSAVAEHAWQPGHVIDWENVEIMDTAEDLRARKVKEALYIRLAPPKCRINRDEGKELSPLWLRTIKVCSGRQDKKPDDHQPHPPTTHPPNIRRPLPGARRMITPERHSTSERRPRPPETPPPEVRRPTPNFRRRSTTPATSTLVGPRPLED